MRLVARHCNGCNLLLTWDATLNTRVKCHREHCDGWAEFVPKEPNLEERWGDLGGEVAEVGCHDGEPGQYYGYDPYNHVGRLVVPLVMPGTVALTKVTFTAPDGRVNVVEGPAVDAIREAQARYEAGR